MSNAESEGSSYCLGDTCGICEHIFCVMPLTKEGLQAKITGSLPDHPGFMVSDCEICGFHQETSIDDLKKYRISPDGSFEELGGATEIVILSASDNWSDSVLPMPVLNHKRIYEPVGRCIYCGATRHSKNRVKLGGEHIIPEGLGGEAILPEASCGICEGIISSAEGFCQKPMLGAFRYRLNLPTKRRKQRPTKMPAEFLIGGKWQIRQVPVSDYPVGLLVPMLPLPEYMLEKPLKKSPLFIFSRINLDTNINSLLVRFGATNLRFSSGVTRISIFTRMLAKIAHAYTCAELGLNGFQPLLIPAAKGDASFPTHHFVGGIIEDQAKEKFRHRLKLKTVKHKGKNLHIVTINLFADLGFPKYVCVAGIPPNEKKPLLPINDPATLPWRIPDLILNKLDDRPTNVPREFIHPKNYESAINSYFRFKVGPSPF